MTTEHQASRTLVKSLPELWAECSDAGSLARHIGEFGEVRITRLEPEKIVAWEGEHASGTVEIEPSGWGTKVTLTAETKVGQLLEEPVPGEEEPVVGGEEPAPDVEEPIAGVVDPVAIAFGPAINETESVEEAADAKVEETLAEPDPAVAADPSPARGWRRMIARTRAVFKSRAYRVPAAEAAGEPPAFKVAEWPVVNPAEPPVFEIAEPPPPVDVAEPPPVGAAEPPAVDAAESAPVEPETPEPGEEKPSPSIDPEAVLSAALDSLGQAHHRPFSRA